MREGTDRPAGTDPVMDAFQAVLVGGPPEQVPIVVVPYDPAWPTRFDAVAGRLRVALGDTALVVEHVGSTAVPGLAAKPIIDVLLLVPDATDEPAYVPALEEAGFELRVREPSLDEHRMVRSVERDVHVHVYGPGAADAERLLLLRDHLRAVEADRQLYEATKQELATMEWPTMQHYAEAKSEVIVAILARARQRRPAQ